MANGLTPEEQARLNALTAEEIRQKQELGKLNAEELAYLQKRMGFDEKELAGLQKRVGEAEKLLGLYKEQAEVAGENSVTAIVAREQEIEFNNRKIQELEKIAKMTKEEAGDAWLSVEAIEEEIRQIEEKNGKLRRSSELQSMFNARLSESEQIAGDFGDSIVQAANVYGTSFTPDKIKRFGRAMANPAAAMAELASKMADFGLQMIGSMIGVVQQAFDTEAAFRKATGASQEMARGMTEVYEEVRITGVSMAQVSESGQALFGTFTDFTMVSGDMQKSLVETSSVLGQLGVSYGDFAQGVQNATKFFGQSADQAEETSRELVTFANELGIAPSVMAAEFAKAGPELAKFGDQGVQAFKDLQHISKITGMEMSKVLAITNKFDTFEGAAEQTGKLNAALGGNFVNAMDLMTATDPAERFGMLRDSILDAGLSFDDMSYYQKQFYTESLGLADTGDLAMMLSGNMDDLAGATNATAEELIAQKEAAASMQSMQEQLNALMASFVPIITPVIDILQAFMSVLMGNAKAAKFLIGVLLILYGISVIATGGLAAIPAIIAGIAMALDSMGILQPLLAGIKEAFLIMLEPIQQIWGSFKELGAVMAETFGLEGGGGGAFMKGFTDFIVKVFVSALMTPFRLFGAWVNFINIVIQAFRALLTGNLEPLTEAFKSFGRMLFKLADPVLFILSKFDYFKKALDGLAMILFEKPYASTFLEGLGKFASGFLGIGSAFKAILNPIDTAKAAFEAIGSFIGGIIDKVAHLADIMVSAVQSAFVTIATSGVDETIGNIVAAINDLSAVKAVGFTAAMTATAAAGAVTAPAKMIAAAVGGGEAGGGGANQTVRQPISLTLNGKALEDFVLEVIGKEIIAVNVV